MGQRVEQATTLEKSLHSFRGEIRVQPLQACLITSSPHHDSSISVISHPQEALTVISNCTPRILRLATIASSAARPYRTSRSVCSASSCDRIIMDDSKPQAVTGKTSTHSESSPIAGSSPLQNAKDEATSRGKNRFSLNVLRLPFSSPRKETVDIPKAKAGGSPTNTTAAPLTGFDRGARSSTAATVVSPTVYNSQVPLAVRDMSEISAAGPQLASPNVLQPRRSALTAPANPASSSTARAVSPHLVSFSPSTEEMADEREHALSLAAREDVNATDKVESVGTKSKRSDDQSSKPAAKPRLGKWRGFKSHSTSDLTATTRRLSLDSTLSDSSVGSTSTAEHLEAVAALPGAAAARRRLFRWDRKGIHHSASTEKGKVARVKVTKMQAVAARHAKTLEQVINAGMGLHPIPPPQSSTEEKRTADADPSAKASKKKVPRAKPVPVVKKSQLKGLKSALMDVDKANNIISELRSMPVPLDMMRTGLAKMVPDTQIGTAGEHGEERVLTANLPDTVLEGNVTKDDSEIRKRTGATADALASSTPNRPPIERKAKSAAEEALRRITLQAEATISPQKAMISARTSSLPPAVEDAEPFAPVVNPPIAPAASTKPGVASPGARPLKMVCLDCGETEAHRRHAEHLEAASVIKTGATSPASPTEAGHGFNLTDIATGAGTAIVGVGVLFGARSAAASAETDTVTAKAQTPSARPPMLKSMSVANLPSLQDGPRLMGSMPLQLIMDPVGSAAQSSGAFDMLADVSGAAIRATRDMESIHPPLDRMAIFVHWWGFEITLPEASMSYLNTAHSVSGALLSFLQTMAVTGGVPELLPFIKYISTFMEVEYKAIQAQDQGHGVCIAGTWFMPMALVPRAWDYPLDGPIAEKPVAGAATTPASLPASSKQIPTPALMPMPVLVNDAKGSPKKHLLKKKKSTIASGVSVAQA